jgi:hypothetical protein
MITKINNDENAQRHIRGSSEPPLKARKSSIAKTEYSVTCASFRMIECRWSTVSAEIEGKKKRKMGSTMEEVLCMEYAPVDIKKRNPTQRTTGSQYLEFKPYPVFPGDSHSLMSSSALFRFLPGSFSYASSAVSTSIEALWLLRFTIRHISRHDRGWSR